MIVNAIKVSRAYFLKTKAKHFFLTKVKLAQHIVQAPYPAFCKLHYRLLGQTIYINTFHVASILSLNI